MKFQGHLSAFLNYQIYINSFLAKKKKKKKNTEGVGVILNFNLLF